MSSAVVVSALLGAAAAAVLVGLPDGPRRTVLLPEQPAKGGLRKWVWWAWPGPDPVVALPRVGAATVGQLRLGPIAAVPLVGAATVGQLLAGPVAALWCGVVAAVGLRAGLRRRARQAREAERAAAGEGLEVLAAELRAGRPPSVALAVAAEVALGPFGLALTAAAGSTRVGADPAAGLRSQVGHSALPELLRGLAACWQVCSATGSSLAASVTRLSEAMRSQEEQRRAVEAELAGPRATAVLLALLPLAGLALAAGLGADPLRVLLHTPLGATCLAAGVALDLLGLWWTSRIVVGAGGAR